MNSFENDFADRLNDAVDTEAGTRRTPPPFVRPQAQPPVATVTTLAPRRRRRTIWLAAVAAFVLVSGGMGALAVAHSRSSRVGYPASTPSGVATSSVVSTSAPVSSTPSVAATSTDTPTNAYTPGPSAAPSTTKVNGTTLVLPAGWVVTVNPDTGPAGSTSWCIDPVASKGTCTISLTDYDLAQGNPLDVDTEGGLASDPEYCTAEREQGLSATDTMDVADVRSFGGREAEHRVWTHNCVTSVVHVEQYEVAYGPAWCLFSEKADSAVSATMAQIAALSTLPAQIASLRLMDRGYVRSVTKSGSSYVISLDRVYGRGTTVVNKASTTYTYTVPAAAVTAHGAKNDPPKVGDRVDLSTNGTVVTQCYTMT